MLTTSEKIIVLLERRKMNKSDLAAAIGTTRQNLGNKLSRNNFSENDLRKIADALGTDLQVDFIDRETGESI